VRTIEEVNKEAMLAEKNPDVETGAPGLEALIQGVPHIRLTIGKEAFIVEPLKVDPS
jgi:phage host-nuclease inhibitor protein Gam